MMRHLLIGLLCLGSLFSTAQVVNTEKLRSDRKEAGWSLEVDVNLSLTRNKAGRNLSLGSHVRAEYLRGKQKGLAFGRYNLGQFRNVYDSTALPSDWLSNCFIHLRCNCDLSPRWTLEAFAQAQYDEVQEIRIRLLSGVGPRGELVNHKRGTLYLGVPLRNPLGPLRPVARAARRPGAAGSAPGRWLGTPGARSPARDRGGPPFHPQRRHGLRRPPLGQPARGPAVFHGDLGKGRQGPQPR